MHRKPLLDLLNGYLVRFPEEEPAVTRLSGFVRDHSNCFDRELSIGHITGSAWLLDEHFERALMTHHRKLNRWLQPGGHADGESNVIAVSLREAEEESGLEKIEPYSAALFDIDIHEIPARKTEPAHFHYDCRFLLRSVGSDSYVVSEESHDLAWIPLDEMARYTTEESIARMVRKTAGVLSGTLDL